MDSLHFLLEETELPWNGQITFFSTIRRNGKKINFFFLLANSRNGKKIKLFPPSVWREAQEQVRLKKNWVCAHSVTVCELSLCTKDRAASPQMGLWKWRQKRWHVPSGIFSNWPCLAQTCARSLSARRPRIICTSSQIFPEERRGPTQHRIFAEHPTPPFPWDLPPPPPYTSFLMHGAWHLNPLRICARELLAAEAPSVRGGLLLPWPGSLCLFSLTPEAWLHVMWEKRWGKHSLFLVKALKQRLF